MKNLITNFSAEILKSQQMLAECKNEIKTNQYLLNNLLVTSVNLNNGINFNSNKNMIDLYRIINNFNNNGANSNQI